MTTPNDFNENTQLRKKGMFDGVIPTAPDPTTELVLPTPPKTPALDAMYAAEDTRWESQKAVYATAEAAIREAVGNAFPHAATARFASQHDMDGFDISFVALLDDNGTELVLDEDDCEKFDDMSDELTEIGGMFNNAQYVEENFGTHQDGLLINLKPAAVTRTVDQADADLESLDAQLVLLAEKRVAVTCEALALSVRERFEDAQTIHFQHASNLRGRSIGKSGLALVSVSNADGDSVWDLQDLTVNGEYEAAREWQQSLNKYVRALDHDDKVLTPSAEKHFGVDLDLGPSAL